MYSISYMYMGLMNDRTAKISLTPAFHSTENSSFSVTKIKEQRSPKFRVAYAVNVAVSVHVFISRRVSYVSVPKDIPAFSEQPNTIYKLRTSGL